MKIYQHQAGAIEKAIKKKRYGIYHEQGLGKTFTAIAIAKFSLLKQETQDIYVVCPAFLIKNWEFEINKFEPTLLKHFKIFSYEKFSKIPEEIRGRIYFLIIDEAHYIKNRKALRTNAVVSSALSAERVLLLTGTPIGNNGILDMYTHLVCLEPTHKYAKFKNFFLHFLEKEFKDSIFPTYKTINENEFFRIMDPWSERKTKQDCLDLPDKIYSLIPCKGIKVRGNLHIAHKMIVQEGYYFQLDTGESFASHNNKISILLDLLEIIGDKQVVIYCAFKESVQFIHDCLYNHFLKIKAKVKIGTFVGEMTMQDKNDTLMRFVAGEFQYLVATIQSLSVGVTLVNVSDVIYYSRNFSCTDRVQSEDRFHRIGQTNKVTYYDIVAEGVDRKAFELVEQKKDFDEIKKELELFEG